MTKTDRFEQEVTINLDAYEGDEGAGEKDEKQLEAEMEEAILKIIGEEVTIFFMDYGIFVASEIIAIVTTVACSFFLPIPRIRLAIIFFFGCLGLLIILRYLKHKDSKLKKTILLLEEIACCLIIGAAILQGSRFFFLPFLIYTFVILVQVAFTCINLAESIDNTFLFKLVNSTYTDDQSP